jgi:hypothetical protein
VERGSTILAAVLAGALGGVFGGLATGWLRPHPLTAKPASTDFAARDDDARELTARVAALEAQVTRLQQRAAAGPTPSPVAAPRPSADGARPRALPDDPVFEAAVRDVMDRAQQERAGERDERRMQGAQRWADQLAEKLQLAEPQKASVLAVGRDLLQRLRDMRDAAVAPPTGPSWAEQRTALVAQGEKQLSELLSPQQMQAYRASSDLHLETIARGGGRGRGGP